MEHRAGYRRHDGALSRLDQGQERRGLRLGGAAAARAALWSEANVWTYSWPVSSLIAVITSSAICCLAFPGGPARPSGWNPSRAPLRISIPPGRAMTEPFGFAPRMPAQATGRTGTPDFRA